MSEETQANDITKRRVVYTVPDMDAVTIRRDIEYQATKEGSLTMDLYLPPGSGSTERIPAVVLASGYPDPGYEAVLGCKQKEMGACVSWGQLLAASGLVAVTYTNREPARDLNALLRHLRGDAAPPEIDKNRIGVWACSGNVPMALSVLMQDAGHSCKCGVLCYGFMLDLEGSTAVAEAAAQFGFVNPCAGKPLDLLQELPLFVVRAGQDAMPRLNETVDLFLAGALSRNLPLTLVNHASAPHAFDLLDDSETSREVIREILAFLRFHLLASDASTLP